MAKPRLKKPSQWLILVPAALIIAAAGYWNIGTDSAEQNLARLDTERTIDFYTTNSVTTQFNKQGQLHYNLDAAYTEHIQQTDTTLMTQPYLKLYQGKPNPWHIKGDTGQVGPNGDVVDLYDNVSLEHLDEKNRPFLLTTSHLQYLATTEEAHTQADVRIETEQGTTTAKGMRAFAETGIVKLLSRVRGSYDAQ